MNTEAVKNKQKAKAPAIEIASPSRWIRDAFLSRQKKNSSYSLRAYARDIGLSQTLLSLVLNGKRPLTLKQAHKISALLQMAPSEQKAFINATLAALPENAKITQKIRIAKERTDAVFRSTNLDIEKFQLISSWYHLPILDLTTTVGFESNSGAIAKRLGITKLEAEAAIERLLLLGLLVKEKGKLKKSALHVQFPTHESRLAVRSYHDQMIEKAQNQLKDGDEQAFVKRSITGVSMAIDVEHIDEAKQMIEEFKAEFARRFTTGKPTEVYQVNVQMFPLTQTQSPKK